MRPVSQLDIAPTIAGVLGVTFPRAPDGSPIEAVGEWGCDKALLIIVDSLGYDLYRWLEPDLNHMPALGKEGLLLRARAVSNHTSPAIASILSGLLPEHHNIRNTEDAKASTILSVPEIASSAGLKTAVIMEKEGAEVYQGLIDFIGGVPDTVDPLKFDREICRLTLEALSEGSQLTVSYFIGLDKFVHQGLGPDRLKEAAVAIDGHTGQMVDAALPKTLVVICGDHPIHAGQLKRNQVPYCVPLILGCR